MLKRKIEESLKSWKEKNNKLPLIIKGCRQVGKSFSVREFGKNNYDSLIEINFEEMPTLKEVFEGNLDQETIFSMLSLYLPKASFITGKTLLFLDEIQACPKARTALKFLAGNGKYDIIATGSLLGINYHEVPSFPVGYVEHLTMEALDFEEFLWAIGVKQNIIDTLRDCFESHTPVLEPLHIRFMELFREYLVVGGMPRVVDEFQKERNFASVLKIQNDIIADFYDDIAKYAKDREKAKARDCFSSIPRHLAKDYKKFRYSLVEHNGSARKYGGSLRWLYDAGIIDFCHNLSRIEHPLEGYSIDSEFKVYMKDTGLLVSMLEEGSQKSIIKGDIGIYKGAIYENIIADTFSKKGRKLYYYAPNSNCEIDFVIIHEGLPTALEVKSADNTKSKSLKTIMAKDKLTQAIRLSAKNVGSGEEAIITYPLYMAFLL